MLSAIMILLTSAISNLKTEEFLQPFPAT